MALNDFYTPAVTCWFGQYTVESDQVTGPCFFFLVGAGFCGLLGFPRLLAESDKKRYRLSAVLFPPPSDDFICICRLFALNWCLFSRRVPNCCHGPSAVQALSVTKSTGSEMRLL